jgi:hypothetical protein
MPPALSPTAADPARRSTRLDGAGIAISVLCLLHCLALPILVALVPAIDAYLPVKDDHVVHVWLLAIAAPVSIAALGLGARSLGVGRWLALGSLGLAAMLLGVVYPFAAAGERIVTAVGVTLLAAAHFGNWTGLHRRRGHAHRAAEGLGDVH